MNWDSKSWAVEGSLSDVLMLGACVEAVHQNEQWGHSFEPQLQAGQAAQADTGNCDTGQLGEVTH